MIGDTRQEDSAGSTRGSSDSELHQQVADFTARLLAISDVLRAIVRSPHELQPVLQTILESAIHLCRADGGSFRIVEEAGFRLVALKLGSLLAEYAPKPLYERGSFIGGFFGSKSPIHIADLAAEIDLAGEARREAAAKFGVRTCLFVPLVRNDELIGSLALGRMRIEPFKQKEIELVTDFAAQAAIGLEITRRERQLHDLQIQLAHANRVVTMGQLSASITHEVKQPIASTRNNISAALHFLDRNPPDLQEVREALACAVKDTDRADAIVVRMCALMRRASRRSDRVDMNDAVQEVIELTRGEALKNGVSVKTQFAEGLPMINGDRIQLQQVVLNLIVNALQAMGGGEGARDVLISTCQIELNNLCVGVQDTGPGLSPEALSRLFEPFYTTKPNGMGMGLTICRSIVESHGGRLWVSACQPHGALFQFAIPARPA
jgi:C4-dicarboxylate-specific signal transduction histidine kinase